MSSMQRTMARRMHREGRGKHKERVRVTALAEAGPLPGRYANKLALASLPLVGGMVKSHLSRRYASA